MSQMQYLKASLTGDWTGGSEGWEGGEEAMASGHMAHWAEYKRLGH